MPITLSPIGYVRNQRRTIEDDFWGDMVSQIVLDESYPADSLLGIETFSHAEIIFYFDQVDEQKIVLGARHPRNNPDWPRVGIFAQRGKNRPNRLGLTTVKILRREGHTLEVANLDAVDGTPVLDIKPVLAEFLPQEAITQPAWATALMQDYWKTA